MDGVQSIGDEALYGFVKQNEGTLVGPRRELAEALRPEIDKMPQRPHLRHAIARFMGDTSLAAIAERDIAGWWKQFDKPREVRRPRIFVSCVDEDRAMVRELLVHLRVIEREFPASIWHDGQLRAGSVWNAEIKSAIDQSDVFILLLSPAYTGSIYILDHELPAIRVRIASGDGVLVLPVVLQRCMWKLFGSYSQMTPHDGQHVRPISDWRPMQKGYAAAAQEIANSIENKFEIDPDLGTPKSSLIRGVVR